MHKQWQDAQNTSELVMVISVVYEDELLVAASVERDYDLVV